MKKLISLGSVSRATKSPVTSPHIIVDPALDPYDGVTTANLKRCTFVQFGESDPDCASASA